MRLPLVHRLAHRFCKCPVEEDAVPRSLHRRGTHLHSKKTTVDKLAYVLLCNKYLQVSM